MIDFKKLKAKANLLVAVKPEEEEYSLTDKALAWSVHLLTASGIVGGFMAIIAITQHQWTEAMAWLIVCLIIDGIDGTFARLFKVKSVLPNFDGQSVDYVIDFATYAIIPAFFFYEAFYAESMIAHWMQLPGAAAILLTSAIYYGKQGMVSDDMHFIGFPVMWNAVVFYMFFVFHFNEWWNFALIFLFCILHFIPLKYLYPSRTVKYRKLNLFMAFLCVGVNSAILLFYPTHHISLIVLSVLTVSYFMFMAIYTSYFDKSTAIINTKKV